MTDRELLELASKAAGVFLTKEQFERECTSPWDEEWEPYYDDESGSMHGWRTWYGRSGERGGWEGFEWNPLADNGDALRLAVALRLDVRINSFDTWVYHSRRFNDASAAEPHGDAPLVATRRAIVRAAAEIQRAKENNDAAALAAKETK